MDGWDAAALLLTAALLVIGAVAGEWCDRRWGRGR